MTFHRVLLDGAEAKKECLAQTIEAHSSNHDGAHISSALGCKDFANHRVVMILRAMSCVIWRRSVTFNPFTVANCLLLSIMRARHSLLSLVQLKIDHAWVFIHRSGDLHRTMRFTLVETSLFFGSGSVAPKNVASALLTRRAHEQA